MDIGKSFTYVFEDQEWVKKVLIGGLINLIPIVNFAATGYWLTQTKNVYQGRDLPLPEWSDFGGYFTKGLMAFIAMFVYSLPAILIYCCAFILPTVFLGAGANDQTGEPGPLAALSPVLFFCGVCLLLLYLIVLLVFVPALFIRYATTGEFGTLFQFAQAWKLIQANLGGYVMALLVFVIASMVASTIGSIACLVGAAWTGFWASLVGANLFGNFAKGAPLGAGA